MLNGKLTNGNSNSFVVLKMINVLKYIKIYLRISIKKCQNRNGAFFFYLLNKICHTSA